MNELYLYLSSVDSLQHFPNNSLSDFTIHLPTEYRFDGTWTCALRAIKCETTISKDLYVFCDIVEDSYVRDRKMPILQYIPGEKGIISKDYDSSVCPALTRTSLNTLRVYIRDYKMNEPALIGESTTCTLHLQKV